MRDKLKDEEHFRRIIQEKRDSIQETLLDIENNSIIPERINIVKQDIIGDYLRIILSKYSVGDSIGSFKPELLDAIDMTYESWDGFWKIDIRKGKKTIILNQYNHTGYDEILWMLSLGYLLNIPDEYIKKIVDVIDRDEVKDFLLEFIIRAKQPERSMIQEESYQRFFGVPDSFNSLRQAITETDKTKAEGLVKEFVTKEWYKWHKKWGWCHSKNAILSGGYAYDGYWSWETAAVVKIMGLDDSSFRDCPYYPKDMIR